MIMEPYNPYFDLLSEIGMTRHPGGSKATDELIKKCNIKKSSLVLDVGCGIGKTSCYLAKKCGCKVIGIDISKIMIEKAKERSKKEGVIDLVDFFLADAQKLPFNDDQFDSVISESVTSFMEHKDSILNEYCRVTKLGGYVGLNEASWIKENPPTESNILFTITGINKILTSKEWTKLLINERLNDLNFNTYKFKMLNQIVDIGLINLFKSMFKLFNLYITSSYYRDLLNLMARDLAIDFSILKNIFECLGYGIFVGRK